MSCLKEEKWRRGRGPLPRVRIGVVPMFVAACSIVLAVPVAGYAQAPAGNSVDAAMQLRLTAAAEATGAAPSTQTDAASVPPPKVEPQPNPVASAVHLETGADTVRLVFDLSEAVSATAFVLADPKRVVVDLPEVDFRIDPQVGLPAKSMLRRAGDKARTATERGPAALIAAYRFGAFAPGRSRIVIDLTAPARIERAASEAVPGKGQHLVIELARSDDASFAAAAQAARAAQPAAMAAPQALPQNAGSADVKPVIVLDPGHGGIDPGAMGGPGIVEKNIVFDFATELAAKLEAGGRYKVLMTRTSDVFVPLGERIHMARDSNAALFISIHADDVIEDAAGVSGATVYTESDRASDAEAARVAESENRADTAGGVDRKDDASDVSNILLDLTRRETRTYSNVFARTLVNYWRVAERLNKNPHRSAGFVVLKAPDVPSVLLELGYLSNRKDAAELLSPDWRAKATDSVVRSVNEFFAQRQAQEPTAKADAGPIAEAPGGVAVSRH
jgi:N-acetylmuramoyl-L-alanine amidase